MAFLSTKSALTASNSWTSGTQNLGHADTLTGTVFADQAGTLYIEQSYDGTNWDVSTSYAITASDGKGFSEDVIAPFIRVRYVNGGTDQGAFRLYARARAAGSVG